MDLRDAKPVSAPFDPRKFIAENRVHIQHGSIFTDRYLVVHPAELKPENEDRLRDKIRKVYLLDAPSFFGYQPRGSIAMLLGGMVPTSVGAKQQSLIKKMNKLGQQMDTGEDPDFSKKSKAQAEPFNALAEELIKDEEKDPEIVEKNRNGMAMYLVIEEALRARGYLQDPTTYITHKERAETILADLEHKLGVPPAVVIETARTGGVAGVGQLLGVSPAVVQEAQQVSQLASTKHFSDNLVQHWQMGKRQPNMANATIEQKINAGMESRIGSKIRSLRGHVQNRYDVPDDIKRSEKMVVGAMQLLPPPLIEALYELGTEFCYTPALTVDALEPGAHAYGFHRKLSNKPGDVQGVYQIFLSGKEDAESFARLIVHESHHLLFAKRFTPEERQDIDNLAKADVIRLTQLKGLMDGWVAGTEQEKRAVEQTINQQFALGGLNLEKALGGRTDMWTFNNMVQHAYDRLNIYSNFFTKGGYNSAEDRFYEVLSRYSELRYVRLREEPQLLNFITPGITHIYDQYYLPHIENQLAELKAQHSQQPAASAPQPLAPATTGRDEALAMPMNQVMAAGIQHQMLAQNAHALG